MPAYNYNVSRSRGHTGWPLKIHYMTTFVGIFFVQDQQLIHNYVPGYGMIISGWY